MQKGKQEAGIPAKGPFPNQLNLEPLLTLSNHPKSRSQSIGPTSGREHNGRFYLREPGPEGVSTNPVPRILQEIYVNILPLPKKIIE